MTEATTCIIALSVTTAVLALTTMLGSLAVPLLLWKCFRLETRVEQLDEVVEELCTAAGLRGEKEK